MRCGSQGLCPIKRQAPLRSSKPSMTKILVSETFRNVATGWSCPRLAPAVSVKAEHLGGENRPGPPLCSPGSGAAGAPGPSR